MCFCGFDLMFLSEKLELYNQIIVNIIFFSSSPLKKLSFCSTTCNCYFSQLLLIFIKIYYYTLSHEITLFILLCYLQSINRKNEKIRKTIAPLFFLPFQLCFKSSRLSNNLYIIFNH